MAKIELDYDGVGEILRSNEVRKAIMGHAEAIAADVESEFAVPTKVYPYTTDRAAASVVIAHPSGAALQAKHGALTRAAAREGLEVTAR